MAPEAHSQLQHQEADQKEQQLKYLEFVQIATIQALMRCAILYSYAKDRTGPLKPGVESVEEAVKSVVGPVYDKFHLVPDELLRYVDRKVDESVTAAQKAPVVARTAVSEACRSSVADLAKTVYSKCEPAAKVLYDKYEPKVEQCAVSAWQRLNQLPLFPRVANAVLPKAVYCTEKYNQTVVSTAEKGYRVSAYLPLVPTEKISRVFSDKQA